MTDLETWTSFSLFWYFWQNILIFMSTHWRILTFAKGRQIGTWSWVSDGDRQGPLSHGYRFVSTGSTKIPLYRPTFKRLVKRFCVSQLIYFCSLRLSDKKSPAPRKCSQWQVKLLAQTQSCKIQCVCEQR